MSTPNYGGQPGPNGQFQGQVPAPGEKKSRGKMAAIISVIVVAILVVVGGGAFALSRLGGGGYKSPDALAQGIDSAFAKNSLVSLAAPRRPRSSTLRRPGKRTTSTTAAPIGPS